jgi:cyclopropane fatty-acyl-phospholipid synthase-like methyltransferase
MAPSIREFLLKKDRVCPWWLAYSFDNPLRRLFQNPDRILGDYVKPGQTVMDIGCGLGYFSLALARLVGEKGKVIAVDLQPQMHRGLLRRAERAGLHWRIQPHLSRRDSLGVKEPVDFALAFWMVHEVDNKTAFFEEVRGVMKPEALFLVAEPSIHVTASEFQKTVDIAHQTGLVSSDAPRIRFSRAVIFVS